MQIQIRTRNVEVTEHLRAYVKRRLGFALGRFGDRIAQIVVRVSDANGPSRGGVDKRCQVDVGLRSSATVRVEDTDADWFTSIDRAADRASRSVARVCALARTRASSVRVARKPAR